MMQNNQEKNTSSPFSSGSNTTMTPETPYPDSMFSIYYQILNFICVCAGTPFEKNVKVQNNLNFD